MNTAQTNPAAKLKMMDASLRCFIFGLLGLLPVIGIPFAIAALVFSGQARLSERQLWNPARPYWIVGAVSAAFGLIFWTFILVLIIFQAATNSSYGD